MRDHLALVAAAGEGGQGAWNELAERYAPLMWSICRRYELSRHGARCYAEIRARLGMAAGSIGGRAHAQRLG